MFWLLCGAMTCRYLFKAWPNPVTEILNQQSHHVKWVGLAAHDLVFPTFLFLAGCSWPFSLSSQLAKGATTRQVLWKIAKRFLMLFFLGWVLFGLFTFDPSKMHIKSILGRIGFGWAVMAVVTLFFRRRWWIVALGMFGAYWLSIDLATWICGSKPGAGVLMPCGLWNTGPINRVVDEFVLMFLPSGWQREWFFDACGCILSAFVGYLAGLILRSSETSPIEKTGRLTLTALALGAAGTIFWLAVCPCCKNEWNMTFVLVAGAIDFAVLAVLHLVVDVLRWDRWTLFFRVIGANALAMYIIGHFVDFLPGVHRVFGGVEAMLPKVWTPVIDETMRFLFRWLIFYWLFLRKIFIRV